MVEDFQTNRMQKNKYIKNLTSMIEEVLSENCSVSEFRRKFYFYYLDDVPDDALSKKEEEYFNTVQEQLDWVDEHPDDESRSFGWMDEPQYVEWLRELTEKWNTNRI